MSIPGLFDRSIYWDADHLLAYARGAGDVTAIDREGNVTVSPPYSEAELARIIAAGVARAEMQQRRRPGTVSERNRK